jgi:PAS domain S-box-containing protein
MIVPQPRTRASWVVLACAWATCCIPAADLGLLWATRAGSTGYGWIFPVSPITALAFFLLGGALTLWIHLPGRHWVRRFALAAAGIAGLVALHTLYCNLTGGVPRWESWLRWMDIKMRGPEVGGMSSPTAEMLLLSSFGFATQLSMRQGNVYLQRAGTFAAMLACIVGLLGLMFSVAGVPLYANQQFEVILPVRMLECTLFNFVLLTTDSVTNRLRNWFLGSEASGPDSAPVSSEERRGLWLLSVLGLVALTAAVGSLRIVRKHYQAQAIEALQRMADLKVGQIELWRRERLGDAHVLMRMPGLGGDVNALGGGLAANARPAEFKEWLLQFAQAYGYANVVVFDAALRPLLSEPDALELSTPTLRERLRELRPDSDVVELPPYADSEGRLRWDLLVPLASSESGALEGAILLQTKPTQYIIPILQSWPAEYPTGQSVLWYREGDRLISLGGYRPAPGVLPEELRPLGMVREISRLPPQSLPARVVRGETKGDEGLDYRGVLIIGVGRTIPNSPWLFSSRLDSSEVYAPLRRAAVGIAGIVAGLLLAVGFTTSSLSRQRQIKLLHDRITAELEQKRTAARLGLVMRHANDIIFVTDNKMRFVDANQRAVDTYGWTKEELLQLKIPDLRDPEAEGSVQGYYDQANTPEGLVFETRHRHRDGTTFPVEISARSVEIDGRPHVLSIIRDISERKRAEDALRASEERYRLIADNTSDLIWLYDRVAERFSYASPAALPLLGYSPEEIVGRKILDLVTPASQEAARRAFEQAMRSVAGTPAPVHLSVELEQQHKDGHDVIPPIRAA